MQTKEYSTTDEVKTDDMDFIFVELNIIHNAEEKKIINEDKIEKVTLEESISEKVVSKETVPDKVRPKVDKRIAEDANYSVYFNILVYVFVGIIIAILTISFVIYIIYSIYNKVV